MKRVLVSITVILFFIILGVKQVSATPAYSDAGTLDGVVGLIDVADSGGFSAGSTAWVEQDVSSTYTGTVSSFSIVARSYPYTGSPSTLLGYLTNQNNSQSGYAQIAYGSVCDNTHGINTTSTECTVTFLLDQPVTTTVGDVMTMKLDATRQYGSNNTGYQGSTQPRSPSWIAGRIHSQNSGSGATYTWPYTDRQFAWAWNHVTSTFPDNCTENCNDNILFLPGMEGSRLYDDDGKIWEPENDNDVKVFYMDSTGTSTRTDIYTKDVIDESYFGFNVYESLLDDLNNWKNTSTLINDYAVVPYDWRLSINDILNYGYKSWNGNLYYSGDLRATSTPYILEELRTLAQTSRTGKVTIIAHSYGGLVAKALMKRLQDTDDPLLSKIDNLVLVAVPQTGTPEALGAGLHGYHVGLPLDEFPIYLTPQTAREFASTTPMFYNLLPSLSYFTDYGAGYVSTPPITFVNGTTTQIYTDYYGSQITDAAELYAFLLGFEGRTQAASSTLSSPSILSPSLLEDAEVLHTDLDFWTAPTSTTVYQIAGWGEDTLGSLQYADHDPGPGSHIEDFPILTVDGDNTVVVPSALAMSTSTENITRYWLNLRSYNGLAIGPFRKTHARIFEVPQLRNFIINNIITHSTSTLPTYITSDQPTADPGDIRLIFFLHSPLSLSVQDQFGNEINQMKSEVPGGVYGHFGDTQYISVPAGSKPTASLKGFASGSFTLDIQEFSGDKITAEKRFSDIESVTSTKASISISDGALDHVSSLAVDHDGNGVIDKYLAPTMAASKNKIE